MRVEIKQSKNKYDDSLIEVMHIEGKEELYVQSLSDCPEDAIIGRDLISCTRVAELMNLAYEAGERGEGFIVDTLTVKYEDI